MFTVVQLITKKTLQYYTAQNPKIQKIFSVSINENSVLLVLPFLVFHIHIESLLFNLFVIIIYNDFL